MVSSGHTHTSTNTSTQTHSRTRVSTQAHTQLEFRPHPVPSRLLNTIFPATSELLEHIRAFTQTHTHNKIAHHVSAEMKSLYVLGDIHS
jgi:hypothetical protein